MPRTTAELVRGIVDADDSADLTPFIDTATALVTAVCTSSGYGDALLELIERWLAAHYYRIFDNAIKAAHAGSVSAVFDTKVEYGLKATQYGQQAMLLDYLGNLAGLDNIQKTKRKITVGGDWLGDTWETDPLRYYPRA